MVDYFDGKLNTAEIAELMAFIEVNDDIREEFELYGSETLSKETISFQEKKALKKKVPETAGKIHEENYEDYFIAFYEGDLDGIEKEDLNRFLKLNPFLVKEFELHDQLRIVPDKEITYSQKGSLKKKYKIRPAIYWVSSAAAAMLFILMGIYSIMDQPRAVNEKMVTDNQISGFESISLSTPISHLPEMSIQRMTASIQPIDVGSLPPPERKREQEINKLSSRVIIADLNAWEEPAMINVISTYDPGKLYAEDSRQADDSKKGNVFGRLIRKIASGNSNGSGSVKENKEPAFVRILDQSLVVFNTLTGSDSQLEKTYDEKGELKRYRFEGETISWSRDIAPQAR